MMKSNHSDYYRSSHRHRSRDRHEHRSRSRRPRYHSRSRSHSRHHRDYSREHGRYRDSRDYRDHRSSRSRHHHISKSPIKSSNRHSVESSLPAISLPKNDKAPLSTTEVSKRDKELYVTNLPSGLSPKDIVTLLNTAMLSIDSSIKGDPIVNAVQLDNEYTLLEFRNAEECLKGFKLNGISLLNKPIVIGKPIYSEDELLNQKDMFPTLSSFEKDLKAKPTVSSLGNIGTSSLTSLGSFPLSGSSSTSLPSTSKILVSNIPLQFKENDIRHLFKMFGEINSIEMLTDPTTKKFNGQCNIEYMTEKATQDALHYTIGMKLGDNVLYVKRSTSIIPTYNVNITNNSYPPSRTGLGILATSINSSMMNMGGTIPGISTEEYIKYRENNPSKVLCVKNMVSLQELNDKKEFDELYDDAVEEFRIYGKVIQVKIPRPNGEYGTNGIGKVYVEYANRDASKWAKEKLNGYLFRGRMIEAVYHPEESFRKNLFD